MPACGQHPHSQTKSIISDFARRISSQNIQAIRRFIQDHFQVVILQQNIVNLKFQDVCTSFNMDSYEALRNFAKKAEEFDLIFIDPPYLKDMIPGAVDEIFKGNLLKKNGLIVSKIDTCEDIYQGNGEIILVNSRKYGNTTICFYRFKED